jgi:hypothetical protein
VRREYCGDPGPHERHVFDDPDGRVCRGVPDQPREPARCEARACKGTGEGMCDRLLDEHGQCDRPGSHLS